MLSQLQEQVAELIAGLPEAEGFALAGGAALIVRGEIDRQTRDLDFFGLTSAAVDRLVPAVDRALRTAGFTVRHVQDNPGFARLEVGRGDDRTEVDLGADARLFPAEPRLPAPTLSGKELDVDKVLAVFGRAEARDFSDLMAVEPRYGLDRLCELAVEKDRGFTPEVFAEMLDQFRRLKREEFELSDTNYAQLEREIRRWREQALDLAHSRGRRHDRGRNLGHEL